MPNIPGCSSYLGSVGRMPNSHRIPTGRPKHRHQMVIPSSTRKARNLGERHAVHAIDSLGAALVASRVQTDGR